MAKFATERLKAKRVAILTDVKNDYSVGLAKYFKETFEGKGGKIVANQSYSAGDIDFKSQLTSIRSTNPDAVFVPGYYTEVGLIARQARQMGLKVPLLGGDGWDSPKLTEIGGEAMNGHYFSNHYSQEDTSPRVQDFIGRYKAAYSESPDAMAALGYDATLILVEAMERASDLTPSKIRDEISKTSGFKGVTGLITLNSQRNAVKSAVVLKVEAGQFKFQTTVDPT
jgi:branched-chain amino acid transport system substrate-binding protein